MPFVLDASIVACWAFEDEAPTKSVLAFARWHRLSVYDAAYLELARREGFPPATLDRALQQAARAEKLSLLDEAP